jgi:hypothetical protein
VAVEYFTEISPETIECLTLLSLIFVKSFKLIEAKTAFNKIDKLFQLVGQTMPIKREVVELCKYI